MGATKKPRKPYKPKPRTMTQVERAGVRAAWDRIETDMLALEDGADCTSIVNGLCRVIAPAHTIAEDRGMDAEVVELLDAGMHNLNLISSAGMRWDREYCEQLTDAGWAAQQIMAQAAKPEQEAAIVHCVELARLAAEIRP